MIVSGGRGLTQAADNCFILIDDGLGFASPVMMVGEIFRQSSQGRDNPPLCANGFDTAGTAFALGHIMALELGGCDVSENIVPQYGQWQGNANGRWRKMEKALVDADTATRALQQMMVVAIDYDATAPMTTIVERTRFAMGEKLMHFTDPRIPTRFRVWAVPKSWAHGTVKMADFLAATLAAKQALFAPLATALAAREATIFDETITAMPVIDRDYWRDQMLRGAVREEHQKYVATQNQKIADWANAGAPPGSTQGAKPRTGGPIRAARNGAAVRRAINAPFHPGGPKPVDPLNLAKWAQDNTVQQGVVAALKGPPSRLPGWTSQELVSLQAQHVDEAVFG
jgi:hypothetical protein